MDCNLRRLKHELDSLWQSDEGLQAQMNSVIGALQELKLLQVQTALEELEFSSKTSQASSYTGKMLDQINYSSRITHLNQTQNPEKSISQESFRTELTMEPSLFLTSSPAENRHIPRRVYGGSLSTSSSFSSQEDTTDNSFSSYDIDDSTDWTASLMNHSRNRQPLVLGDNVFADLVGNWLDLPDVEGQAAGEDQNDSSLKETLSESSTSGHSQDLSRKLSLTANIFKRVLRRVRPRHHQESEGMDGCKQPKITCRKPKSDISKPFWVRTRGMKKKTTPTKQKGMTYQGSEGLTDRGWVDIVEKRPSVFDYSSAVWV
ncbi:PAK4-inhibitor INKA2-like isoform X1 [Carassius auratus]|uniref:PAK4-inhibitor INKA2 n=2 Tax=Carassius auratus TaxID=7957 RepID=A0A6P6PXS5_CARAU|nr:PAK4-inhibitor INKA2-like isoform X1 [Carassius auratus]XP_026125910.1 PAK4-inhibitor INKA2-like isoform X1 [Carassius auratus]